MTSRRKNSNSKRKQNQTQSNVILAPQFDAEAVPCPQIEVGSEGTEAQIGVGSAPDNSKIDDTDGSDGDLDSYDDDEVEIRKDDDDDLELFTEVRRRFSLSIAHYCEFALGSPPAFNWLGPNGTIIKICRTFQLEKQKRRNVRKIFTQYCEKRIKMSYMTATITVNTTTEGLWLSNRVAKTNVYSLTGWKTIWDSVERRSS